MIEDSDFMYNKAVINGGAIYTDQLDVYDIQIRNTTFESNLGGLFGDNIYAKQTARSLQEIQPLNSS